MPPGTLKRKFSAFSRPNQPGSPAPGAAPALRGSPISGWTARTTSADTISPRPTAASTSSSEARARRGSTALTFSSAKALPLRSKARTRICRPRPEYCARTALRVARRMAARALPVATSPSQAGGGTWPSAQAISTSSPLASSEISAAMRPLILAPTAVSPMPVWTA